MNNKIITLAIIIAAAVVGSVQARNYRAPFAHQNGPLRYDVYMKDDKWSINVWSTGYCRGANKAFLKHGTTTKNFASVLFGGQDNFKVTDAFTPFSNNVCPFTENYNLNIRAKAIMPRASYSEHGMMLGARFEYPVWKDKGRIGLRANVPFRTIRVERDNDAETADQGTNEHIILNDLSVNLQVPQDTNVNSDPGQDGDINLDRKDLFTNFYRVSFVKDIPYIRGGRLEKFIGDDGNNVIIGNNNAYDDEADDDGDTTYAHPIPYALVYQPRTQVLPNVQDRAFQFGDNVRQDFSANDNPGEVRIQTVTLRNGVYHIGPNALTASNLVDTNTAMGTNPSDASDINVGFIRALPRNSNELEENVVYAFEAADGDAGIISEYQKLLREEGDKLWLMAANADNGTILIPATDADLQDRIKRYGSQSTEQYLFDAGYFFQTTERTGLGDITLDAFYEHTFNKHWRAEVMLGILFPTGGGSNSSNNPYRADALLGNGNHFEIKIGGNVGWQTPLYWLNLKADASYSFVIEATEKLNATYKGATVSGWTGGFGDPTDADVDWGYFEGNLDATMYHPDTDDLSLTVGYGIYYKAKDNIHFKQDKTTNPILFGRRWDNDRMVNGMADPNFVDYDLEIDNSVAERNTKRIAHRFHFEGHWLARPYMSLYAGGAYTFAGQYIPRESDFHVGMKVEF